MVDVRQTVGKPTARLSLPGRIEVEQRLQSSKSLSNTAQVTSLLKISALLSIQFVESGATHSHRVGGRRMSEPEAFRICPHCGSQEVPKLIVRSAGMSGSGSSWRCRACDRDWSDAEYHHLRAS
jgi:formate dehydrogenase maturation protein FdhE